MGLSGGGGGTGGCGEISPLMEWFEAQLQNLRSGVKMMIVNYSFRLKL